MMDTKEDRAAKDGMIALPLGFKHLDEEETEHLL